MTDQPTPLAGEFLLYETADGKTRVECRFVDETLWLTQALMAELFQTSPQNITLHLKVLYGEGEISQQATCKEFLQVRPEGARQVQRTVKFYNLDRPALTGPVLMSVTQRSEFRLFSSLSSNAPPSSQVQVAYSPVRYAA